MTPDQWLQEILLAWKDAQEATPFARLTGAKLTDADLFHLAPVVCLKFRGRSLAGAEADRVTKGALANYLINAEKGLESNPRLAFALCYVAAHLVLSFVDEQTAAEIMGYCEKQFDGPGSASAQESE
jgi:hypothetical protein